MKTAIFLKQVSFFLFFFLLHLNVKAQKQANNWYFGYRAGLSFNSSPPQALTNGQAIGSLGHAAISDVNGNLLFYTSGDVSGNNPSLFDRRHIGMPNSITSSAGGNLGGNSLIVPWPGQPQKYFLFSRYLGLNGAYCSYSVVDMALNGGFGDISTSAKYQFVHSYDAIEVLGVQHRNNRDFWVIYQNDSTNIFSSYLVSPTGLNLTPIISTPAFSPGNSVNLSTYSLKVSPDGKTLAMVISTNRTLNSSKIELFNFDATTGMVTYKGMLPDSVAEGLEFSPDGTKLYATRNVFNSSPPYYSHVELNQYDLEAGNKTPTDIYNSKVKVYQSPPFNGGGGTAMQVGPDGKIYVNTFLNPLNIYRYLSVINRPNLKGTACRFIPNMIDIDPNNSGLHLLQATLPTFIQSYFYRPKITMQQTCFGDTAFFALGNNAYVDSVEWNFGDPASGVQNTSTLFNPKHFYATPGPKQVQAIVHFNFDSDTLQQTIYIPATITKPNFGPDRSICPGDTLILHAYQPGASYEWQDSLNTDSVYVVTQPGTYWVQVSNGCGTLTDSITVSFAAPLTVSLPPDALLCPGQSLILQVNSQGGNVLWSDATTANTFTVTKPGTYWVELSNACGSWRDSITVTYRPAPTAKWLPDDITLCKTDKYIIAGNRPDALSYRWQDGSTNSSFTATVSGIYWLEVTTLCSTIRDSINVTLIPSPPLDLGPDQVLCSGDKLPLQVNSRGGNIRWQDNSTDTIFTVTKAGTYWAEISNSCGSWRDSVTVTEARCFSSAFIANIITPNSDNLNDKFEPKGLEPGIWELTIYNRWGSLLYRNKNYSNQWPEKPISDGIYYYLLRNKTSGKTYKGWVEVVK